MDAHMAVTLSQLAKSIKNNQTQIFTMYLHDHTFCLLTGQHLLCRNITAKAKIHVGGSSEWPLSHGGGGGAEVIVVPAST